MIAIEEKHVQRAEELKKEGNQRYAEGRLEEAIELYTEGISNNPFNHVLYANRSIANFKLEYYKLALEDANRSIELNNSYLKGYYRKASAHMALGQLKEAIKDFKAVIQVCPSDPSARQKLSACEKEHRRIQFEKAIFVESTSKSAIEMLGDIESIKVEVSYDGPHLDGPITLDFILKLLDHMKEKKLLHKKYTYKLLIAAREYFYSRPPIEDIVIPENGKITVCGDIHGQYYDLLNIWDMNGLPSPENLYLFNGDIVDRGSFSVECILALLSFKLLYPEALYLSRGNHEADDMNRVYGFEGEVKAKYTDTTFRLFSEIFNAIPLGNLIEERIFVLHGGLFSRDGVRMEELRQIDRFKQPGSTGLMCELLWSDPQHLPGRSASKRGVGLQFGPDVTKDFCDTNNLKMIIRSHEVKHDGYEVAHDGRCVTIFSAPNYCDASGNMGAYIHITKDLECVYKQFQAVPHPGPGCMHYGQRMMF